MNFSFYQNKIKNNAHDVSQRVFRHMKIKIMPLYEPSLFTSTNSDVGCGHVQ